MTPHRFMAFIGGGPSGDRLRRLVETAAWFGLQPVFRGNGLVVLASRETPVIVTTDNHGVVVGIVFERGGEPGSIYRRAASITAPDGCETDLLGAYWGSFVAFAVDEPHHAVRVCRDPSGSIDCYRSRQSGIDVVYSDVAAAHGLGLIDGKPDATMIAQHLTYGGLRVEQTALGGVLEVLPGSTVSLDGAGAAIPRCSWTPWAFADKDHQITDHQAAAALVRLETQRCVSAWASQSPSILHGLSGGLDSSIVAACLAGDARALSCINVVTPDPGADERLYAEQVARHIAAPLCTVSLDVADSSLGGLAEIMTARPGSGMLHQVIDRVLTREVERTGAQTCFSGGGGDNVFCYLHTAAPATDALRRHGLGPVFWQSLGDLAAMHGCTTWRAGRLAFRKAWRPLKAWPSTTDFLARDATPASPPFHPWLQAPRGALPGQQEHIYALMSAQNPVSSQASHGPARICYPLLSQPLVELCLRIPSWMWIAGGRNRAVARDAFGERLPRAILQRRTKGDFTGFLGALYETHRLDLADLLLDGWLATQGLLDRDAIEAYLTSKTPVTDNRFYRLMGLATAEVWARSWLSRPAAAMLV